MLTRFLGSNYIDNAFKKGVRDHNHFAQFTNGYKRPSSLVEISEESSKPPPGSTKRKKLSDALQDKEEGPAAQPSMESAREGVASPLRSAAAGNTNPGNPSSPSSGPQRNIGVEVPVKKHQPLSQPPARATRSMSRQAPTTLVW